MSTATAPGAQLLMTCFMLWMSGSSLQIFSIMMLVMAFIQPLQRLFAFNKQFSRYETSADLSLPKLIYIGLNLLGVGVALYKSHTMGLLPTADNVVAYAPVLRVNEVAVPSIRFS
jgi:hypothetical protein